MSNQPFDAATLLDATFPGSGEMAARCRALDWSATALGPVSAWSQSLRTTTGIVLASRNPMFLWWGPRFVQLFNDAYRPSLGDDGRDVAALGAEGPLFWTDIWDVIYPEIAGVMNGESTWHENQLIPILRNGRLEDVWWTYGYSVVPDDDGNIGGVLVVCQETTHSVVLERERDALIASLEATQRSLKDQFAKLPVPTFLWEARDAEFVLLDHNEVAPFLVPGIQGGLGKTVTQLFPVGGEMLADFHRCLAEGVVVRRNLDVDFGSGARHIELIIGPQPPSRVLLYAVDTTDRMALEAQLLQTMKMDAVGKLAGGLAHDFNNLLTVIGAHSSFLLDSLAEEDARREDVTAIQKAYTRAVNLTRQLLTFGRRELLKPGFVDLSLLIEEARTRIQQLLGSDIELVTSTAREPARIFVDAGQMDQLLTILALNARDAMPAGGRLRVTSSNLTILPETPGMRSTIPAGGYVLLEVTDNGVGMDASAKARLFEPFFTTKGHGNGTGLGLSTVYGIVTQSGGFIHVESAPEHGTCVEVYLPMVAPVDEVSSPAIEIERDPARETVLVVEDEAGVRAIAVRILRRHGYRVLEAGSGPEALAVSASFATRIHLVISDVVMPGMGGPEVVLRLREQRSSLKALFMSGFTDDEILRRGISSAAVRLLEKPFAPADLINAAERALKEG